MQIKDMKYFKARKGGKNVSLFLFAFMFFPVFGITALITGGISSEILIPAVICIVFGIALIIYIIIIKRAAGFIYGLSSENVFLKRGSSKRIILISDIKAAGILKDKYLDFFMEDFSKTAADAINQLNIKNWFNNSKIYSEISRWVSVVITGTKTGGQHNISGYNLHLDGKAAILLLKNGELLLITPEETEIFLKSLSEYGINILSGDDLISSIRQNDISKNINFKEKKQNKGIIFAFLAAGLIILSFFTWKMLLKTENNQVEESENIKENTRLITQGQWVNDSSFVFFMRYDHPSAKKDIQKGEKASEVIINLAAVSMLEEYVKQNNDIKSLPDTVDVIKFIKSNASVSLFNKKENDDGVLVHIYEVNGQDLKLLFEKLF